MNYTISNDILDVTISSKGGELQSIQDKEGTQYLWQGDRNSWKGRATNLFPFVGRLTDGTYTYQGETYEMTAHGFVKLMELEVTFQSKDKIAFTLHHSEETKEMYPFQFSYTVVYELIDKKLSVTYRVENKDTKTIYFGVGGHPGFNVPIEKDLAFEDYYLEFTNECRPKQIVLSDTCYVQGGATPFALENNRCISLKHNLFDKDAIVLEEMDREVTIKSTKSTRAIKVTFPDMKYLGIWHTPKKDVPFICIEPWCTLPARQDIVEDIETQADFISLEVDKVYENNWSICVEKF